MNVLIAFLVLLGTGLQMVTSLRELKLSRGTELEWWRTEDDLVDEIPSWRKIARWRRRREVRALRAPEIHREIQHISRVLASWVLLSAAAAAAFTQAAMTSFV